MRDAGRTHGNIFSEVPKLGPALISSIPTPREGHGPPIELDVEADQNLNAKYVFSGAQRKLTKTGSASDRSDKNDGVLKKRDLLPERIHQLIEDVTLLHNTEYLAEGDWGTGKVDQKKKRSGWGEMHRQLRKAGDDATLEDVSAEETTIEHYESPFDGPADLWDELIAIDQRSQQVRGDVFFHGRSVVSKETQLGYEIGSLLHILRPQQDEEVPGADLIWGFILAFIGQSRESLDQERETLDSLITVMKDNHDTRQDDAERLPELEDSNAFSDPAEEVTASAIKEAGFEPHPILVREVLHHQPVLENDRHHKNAVKQVITNIENTVPLQYIDQLYKQIVQDLRVIESRSVPGIDSAQLVIEGLMRPNEQESTEEDSDKDSEEANQENGEIGEINSKPEYSTIKSSTIGNAISTKEKVVSEVLNRLCDESGKDLWTTEPLFKKKSDGWRLTPYGRVFAHILHRRQKNLDLLYWFALGPEENTLYERKLVIEALDAADSTSIGPS